jgi:hypothetical protein
MTNSEGGKALGVGAEKVSNAAGVCGQRYPITGMPLCCARATRGQAAIAAAEMIKFRRLISNAVYSSRGLVVPKTDYHSYYSK